MSSVASTLGALLARAHAHTVDARNELFSVWIDTLGSLFEVNVESSCHARCVCMCVCVSICVCVYFISSNRTLFIYL